MSENFNNVTQRKETLKNILRQLHEGKAVDEVKAEFAALANEINAEEIAEVEQLLINEGMPVTEVQNLCDVHVAVMREALDRQESPESIPGHPVHTFRLENQAAEQALQNLRHALEAHLRQPDEKTLQKEIDYLRGYDRHYLRKENLLFPYLEKYNFYGPTQVMWQTHDQIRDQWKALSVLAGSAATPPAELEAAVASLETTIRDMFYKEDKILFPTALKLLQEADWAAIRYQEEELGYFVVQPGKHWVPKIASQVKIIETPIVTTPASVPVPEGSLPLNTGALTLEQIDLMLRNLPVDVTFVDEKDQVRYFSQTQERIFDRLPAIIGRKVQQCHPPQSVHRVQQILNDFRNGVRSQAEFWIEMAGKVIHIRYFALYDTKGAYRGTIEVSQEISRIRTLQGERRLLDGDTPGA